MPWAKFRKKPVVVEAILWDGQPDTLVKIAAVAGERPITVRDRVIDGDGAPKLRISTLEGVMQANLGDWIICGVAGEVYPCKPDIFEATYQALWGDYEADLKRAE